MPDRANARRPNVRWRTLVAAEEASAAARGRVRSPEQCDSIAQRTTMQHQADGEQLKLDEDFLVALEHGMRPAGGIGIGIDHSCMMLPGQESIRDVILFPQLKPQ